jgi:hypothetical protein
LVRKINGARAGLKYTVSRTANDFPARIESPGNLARYGGSFLAKALLAIRKDKLRMIRTRKEPMHFDVLEYIRVVYISWCYSFMVPSRIL